MKVVIKHTDPSQKLGNLNGGDSFIFKNITEVFVLERPSKNCNIRFGVDLISGNRLELTSESLVTHVVPVSVTQYGEIVFETVLSKK